MTSGRWFLGMNLGTILMETCFAPEGNMEKSRLCEARERATSSEPRAPEARATKKAVLYDNSSSDNWRSEPLMVNGGFIRPFKTTLRCHRGRTSCSRGRRRVILRMTFWRVVSWSVVEGFNSLSTLDIEALWTRMVFTFLFKEKRCTRYSAKVKKDRSFGCRPFSLAQRAKAFQWELYTWLEESLRGSAAISTTVSGILWLFKISRIRATRPDPTVWDLCGIEVVGCWVHTGIVERRSGESWDACSTGAIEGATVVMGVEMLSEWPWCLGISVSSGSFWALWEPGERRKSGPNRPKIGTGRLPPRLCRRGRAKRRWASLCSPLLRTYRSGESPRHKTVCLRLLVEDAIPLGWADWDETEHRRWHSWRREDVWVWELSGTDPVIAIQGSPIRPLHGSERVHQDSSSSSSSLTFSRHPSPCISGRLDHPCFNKRTESPSYTTSSSTTSITGMDNKLGQIYVTAHTHTGLSGPPFQFRTSPDISSGLVLTYSHRSPLPSISVDSHVCSQGFIYYQQAVPFCPIYNPWTSPSTFPPTLVQGPMDSTSSVMGHSNQARFGVPIIPPLVPSSLRDDGCPVTSTGPQSLLLHRCISQGLGSQLADTTAFRSLVPTRIQTPHQLAGIRSHSSGPTSLGPTMESSDSPGILRQQYCGGVHSETRRRKMLCPSFGEMDELPPNRKLPGPIFCLGRCLYRGLVGWKDGWMKGLWSLCPDVVGPVRESHSG